MSQWRTVRFVDEPTIPHLRYWSRVSSPGGLHRGCWSKLRGQLVRVRLTVRISKTKPACGCAHFFAVDIDSLPQGIRTKGNAERIVCRRMLEMD